MLFILSEIWKRVRLVGYALIDNWKYTLPAALLILVVLFAWRSCGKKEIKLDQKSIIEAQKAIETNDREKMKEILAKSDADEETADDMSVNATEKKVEAIQESKAKWSNASDEELRKELEARAKG